MLALHGLMILFNDIMSRPINLLSLARKAWPNVEAASFSAHRPASSLLDFFCALIIARAVTPLPNVQHPFIIALVG